MFCFFLLLQMNVFAFWPLLSKDLDPCLLLTEHRTKLTVLTIIVVAWISSPHMEIISMAFCKCDDTMQWTALSTLKSNLRFQSLKFRTHFSCINAITLFWWESNRKKTGTIFIKIVPYFPTKNWNKTLINVTSDLQFSENTKNIFFLLIENHHQSCYWKV